MGIPIHLFLTDDGGSVINGSSDVAGREGSIEIIAFHHNISIPVDDMTGSITGTRKHGAVSIEKEIDSASTDLYRAAAEGRKLKTAEFRFYKINYSGQEEEYFNIKLEGVVISSISPVMHNIKTVTTSNHLEMIDLRYEKITWKVCDGNKIYSDSWSDRKQA